jgi:hypothetical protein
MRICLQNVCGTEFYIVAVVIIVIIIISSMRPISLIKLA